MPATDVSTREHVYQSIVRLKGKTLADRLLPLMRTERHCTESPAQNALHADSSNPYRASQAATLHAASDVHPSHARATELLAPHKEALGPAYPTIHLLARWSLEHATDDPAPHLLTTYWSLEEATGKSSRTLMRHLVEDGHTWTETVRRLIDVRHNYGEMLVGDSRRPCIVGTVIRFFPKGRLSPRARVCRWGDRDLIAEADAGRTRPCRQHPARYQRRIPRMSAYTALKEQADRFNWVMIHVGRPSTRKDKESLAKLYADIPKQHVLNALRADLALQLEKAEMAGHSLTRTRSRWVELAATTLAYRFGDDVPKSHTALPTPRDGIHGYRFHAGKAYIVPKDGFTNLWRRALWSALREETATGGATGWWLLDRLGVLAAEGGQVGKRNPIAWAWSIVKRKGFEELLRDHSPVAVAQCPTALYDEQASTTRYRASDPRNGR